MANVRDQLLQPESGWRRIEHTRKDSQISTLQ